MEIVSGQAVTDPSQVRVLIYASGRLVHVPASSLFGTLPQDGDPTVEGQIKWDAVKKAILVGSVPSVFPSYPASMALGDLIVGTADARQVKRLAKGSARQALLVKADGSDLEYGSVGLTYGTAQATTSGNAFNFSPTGSPRYIKVFFSGVSLSGTDHLLVQIGPTGGVVTTGYTSTASLVSGTGNTIASSTAGFVVYVGNAALAASGIMELENMTGNVWLAKYTVRLAATGFSHGAGEVTLSGPVTDLRVTRTGTNTFDAGSVNAAWQ